MEIKEEVAVTLGHIAEINKKINNLYIYVRPDNQRQKVKLIIFRKENLS